MASKLSRLANRALRPFGLRLAGKRGASTYDGAGSGRLLADWRKWVMSPTAELKFELRDLRARSRDLCKNNPHGRRFVAAVQENVIGPKGIRLQSRNLLPSGDRDRDRNTVIEQAWKDWGCRANCTVDKHSGWVGVQQLAARTFAMDGEIFVRRLVGFNNPHAYALQLLDADLFDEAFNVPARPGQNQIVMSVEIDAWGAEVAYWAWTRHPSDSSSGIPLERVRIPATEVEHVFIQRRPNQYRGEPWLAPVMVPMQHTGGYIEAEIVAARVAAAKMGFIMPDKDADGGEDPDEAPGDERFFEASAGVIERLKAGDTFAAWSPDHPTTAFGAFMSAMLRMTATGLNMGATTLTGDYTQTNYSSGRWEKLTERDGWRVLQDLMAEALHEPVFQGWFPIARLAGALELPGKSSQWLAHEWRPRGWPSGDPLKDMEANAKALGLRLTSRTRLAAEEGDDFEEILAELAEESDLAAEYGITLPDPALSPAAVAAPAAADSTDVAPNPDATVLADEAKAKDGQRMADAIVARVLPAIVAMQPKSVEVVLRADGLIPAPVVHVAAAAAPDVVVLPAERASATRRITLQKDGDGRTIGAVVEELTHV